MGYIFRKSGAFFLRRSFKGNELYAEVFARYVKVLLKEGLPLEFFIEGGRSRTGKMVMPKYGLLSMILQAYQEKACDDLAVIPVYIGYDRVIEEKAYLKELGGAPKEKEKTTDMIRSGKLLRKRYGRVYMNVGEPITPQILPGRSGKAPRGDDGRGTAEPLPPDRLHDRQGDQQGLRGDPVRPDRIGAPLL